MRDAELSLNGTFNVFRCDRPTLGGGVCILVTKNTPVKSIDVISMSECVCIDIIAPENTIRLACFYVTNTEPTQIRLNRFFNLQQTMNKLCESDLTTIILGDFNLPSINWQLALYNNRINLTKENVLVNTCIENGLVQLVDAPTHKSGSILDLLLTSDPDVIGCITYYNDPPLNTDHVLITFTVDIEQFLVPTDDITLDFNKADFISMHANLVQINWYTFFSGCHDVENMYGRFHDHCQFLISQYTPTKSSSSSTRFRLSNHIESLQTLLSHAPHNESLAKKLLPGYVS